MFLAGDAFGNTTVDLDGSTGNPYRYTARRYDPETGLYYYRARMYDPAIGRFLQPDPIGYAGGINLYNYCGNNAINFVDPWGLRTKVGTVENEYTAIILPSRLNPNNGKLEDIARAMMGALNNLGTASDILGRDPLGLLVGSQTGSANSNALEEAIRLGRAWDTQGSGARTRVWIEKKVWKYVRKWWFWREWEQVGETEYLEYKDDCEYIEDEHFGGFKTPQYADDLAENLNFGINRSLDPDVEYWEELNE